MSVLEKDQEKFSFWVFRVTMSPFGLKLCQTIIQHSQQTLLVECYLSKSEETQWLFPFYATKRATLANKVVEILIRNNLNHLLNDTKVYLYGNDILSDIDNKTILLSTIKFIKDTNRFSWISSLHTNTIPLSTPSPFWTPHPSYNL